MSLIVVGIHLFSIITGLGFSDPNRLIIIFSVMRIILLLSVCLIAKILHIKMKNTPMSTYVLYL